MKELKLSRRTKNDPSMLSPLAGQYEKALVNIIRKAKKHIKALLKDQTRELAVSIPDTRTFKDRLHFVIRTKIDLPAKEKGDATIGKAAKAGDVRAGQFLNRIGITAALGLPVDDEVLELLQARNLAELTSLSADIEKTIMEEVTEGLTLGESIAQISRRIDTEVDTIARKRATRIARTETMYAYNKKAMAQYERHGVEKIKWLTGGSNICENVTGFDGVHYPGGCKGLNGKEFTPDKMPPQPLHPHCKCIPLPVIKEVSHG